MFGEVAFAAYVPHNYPHDKLEPGLNENAFYDPSNFTFPAGTYVCEVEVDPETGVVKIEKFTAVDDFGNIINPMIVEGQVHGGLTQGIGQALTEGVQYDASGQLAHRLVHGLLHSARDRRAVLPGGYARDGLHAQPARREGLRRSGRDRRAGGAHERDHRCARRQGHADARLAAGGVDGPEEQESSLRRTPCTHSNTTVPPA